jgi:lysozyme family protein
MADFMLAIPYVLGNEGGYVNNPRDPGGETNWGICKRDHPDLDIKRLTKPQAILIYQHQYWSYDPIEDQRVATKLLDMAVNMEGTGIAGWAIRIVQMAAKFQVPSCKVDGIWGPDTLASINVCHPQVLLSDMCNGAAEHHRKLVEYNSDYLEFIGGWLVRDAKLPMIQKAAATV